MMGVRCEGTEDKLWKCYHEEIRNVVCPKGELVAGVTCTDGEARELNVIHCILPVTSQVVRQGIENACRMRGVFRMSVVH